MVRGSLARRRAVSIVPREGTEAIEGLCGAPSTWEGAWRAGPGRVGGQNELTSHQVALCRVSVSTGGDQPRRLAVFPLPPQLAHGRGDAGGPWYRGQPRDGAAVGAQVRPGLCQPDPAAAAAGW